MPFDFRKNTQQNILQSLLQRVTNSLDKREGSLISTALAPIAWLASQLYLLLQSIQDNAYIETATGSGLDMVCAGRGISRKQAVKSIRLCYFNVKINIGTKFSTINGDNSIDFVIIKFIELRDDGFYYYQAEAQTAGIIGNGYTGSLQASGYVAGLTVAQITDIIVSGAPAEYDDSLRQRYIDSLKEKPFGGNIASYKTAILAIDGVGAVQIYPFWKGGGTVLCSILTTNFDIASEGLIEIVQNTICPPEGPNEQPSQYGYGVAPIGSITTITTGTRLEINIEAQILPKVGFTISQVKEAAQKNIDDYLLSLRKSWQNRANDYSVKYRVDIIVAQITAAILDYEGVLNIKELKINGGTDDISAIETSERQEVPFLGTINFIEMS